MAKDKKPAKADYAVIIGTIYGPDDRPAAGVKIDIHRADKKKPHWELMSDRRGEFAQRVPAEKADYLVRPDLKDKQAADKAAVTVHIEKDERQDITLHLISQEFPKK
jgi:hypothetical protein